MYQIISSINGNTYQELVQLLIEQSDSFLFYLPNMGKTLVNERNADLMSQYSIGYSHEEDQDLHAAYIKRMQWYIDLIRDDIIKSYADTGYLNQVSNLEIEVHHVAISEKTKDFFAQTNDFSKWKYPALPENPCFMLNGKCVFQCIAHENLCFLYINDGRIKKLLKKNKVEFLKIPDDDIPTLNKNN